MNSYIKTAVLGAATISMMSLAFANVASAHGKGGPRGGPQMNFEQLDTDADGFITKAEMAAQHAKRFADTDTNSDGGVTQDELKAAFDKKIAEHKANAPKEGAKDGQKDGQKDGRKMGHKFGGKNHEMDPEKMEKRLGRMFRGLDENSDGKIELSEMPDRGERFFEKMDTDEDGKVSKAEADAAKDKMGKGRKGEHGKKGMFRKGDH